MYFGGIYCILGEISVHFGLVSSDTSLKIGASCGLSSFITFGRWAFKLSNHRETISLHPIVEWEWAFNLFFKLYSISPKAGYNNAVKCWCAVIFHIIVINSFQPKLLLIHHHHCYLRLLGLFVLFGLESGLRFLWCKTTRN